MAKKAAQKRVAASDSPDDPVRPDAVAVCEDGEVRVHSFVLRMASPVFEAMFTSEMSEQKSKRFKVDVESKAKFIEFYNFLRPLSGRKSKITNESVDYILEMSEYYQVQALKDECAVALAQLPVTVDRLVQANNYKLQRQYKRCLIHIAKRINEWDVSALQAHPETLMDLMLHVKTNYAAVLQNRDRVMQYFQRRESKGCGKAQDRLPAPQLSAKGSGKASWGKTGSAVPTIQFEDSDVEVSASEDDDE